MAKQTFNAIDVETANRTRASICQIGLVRVSMGRISEALSILVNPEEAFEEINTSIHGIDRETVRHAENMRLVHPRLRELIDGTVLVSHSSFDRQALERAADKYGLEMPRVRWLDSGMVARRAWPDKYGKNSWGLKQIAADLGIEFQHHQAGDDARVSAEIVLHACRHTGLDVGDWLEQAEHPRRNGQPDGSGQTQQTERRLNPRGRKPAPKAQPQWAKSLAMILTLEEHRGLSNRAVLGGIDRFIQRWAEEITRDLGETGNHRLLLGLLYNRLNHEERRRWVSDWRALLGRWNPQRRG